MKLPVAYLCVRAEGRNTGKLADPVIKVLSLASSTLTLFREEKTAPKDVLFLSISLEMSSCVPKVQHLLL